MRWVCRGVRFYLVDVFAEEPYAGNQLAVFRDAGGLGSAGMQKIAKEMHFSETTFVTSEKPRLGGYDVRVFTPDTEVPFAGHPTLGTAYIVQSEIIGRQVPMIKLNLKVGQIPVTFTYKRGRADVLWMRQKEPEFGDEFDRGTVARAFGLHPSDLDERLPVAEVSTGLPFIIVPLRSMNAVKRARIDKASFLALARDGRLTRKMAGGALIYSPETYHEENDLNARVLCPGVGVPEDPATGSGNGCLAAYLVRNRYAGDDHINLRVEQGYEIGRRSLLLLRAKERSRRIEVDIGGSVQFVGRGEFPE